MVLHHVAHRAGLVVETAAILHAEILRHGDLDAADMVAVPQRLEHRVGEARVDDVLHRLLAEVVIDAEDVLLGKELRQQAAQRARRLAVVAERLFDHQSRAFGAARLRQRLRHGGEQARRHREIVQRPLRLTKLFAQFGERRRVAVVAIDVAQQADQLAAAPAGSGVAVMLAGCRLARAFSWSRFHPALATPMIGTLRPSSRTSPSNEGKICL